MDRKFALGLKENVIAEEQKRIADAAQLAVSEGRTPVPSRPVIPWFKREINSEWSVALNTSGGSDYDKKNGQPELNPQFEIQVTQRSVVFISQAIDLTAAKCPKHNVFVADWDPNSNTTFRAGKGLKAEQLLNFTSADFSSARMQTREVLLEPNHKYNILCFVKRKGNEAPFTLRVYCQNYFSLKPVPKTAPILPVPKLKRKKKAPAVELMGADESGNQSKNESRDESKDSRV